MVRDYTLNEDEALRVHGLVAERVSTIKNWIIDAVRHDEGDRAIELVLELDEWEKLYAKLNVEAHRQMFRQMLEHGTRV
jgi:hypothetical protein